MNGFEFLENYTSIKNHDHKNILIVILTTSNWDKDRVKANENELVYAYMEKPLSEENLKNLIKHYKTLK